MQLRNTTERYGVVSIVLHWLAAATILGMLYTGYWAWYYPDGEIQFGWLRTHVAIGVAMWLVVAARAIWHFVEQQPRKLTDNPVLSRVATATHATLLVLIGFQLISGPINLWSGGYPVGVFDLITIPNPMPGALRAQHDLIGEVHIWVGRIIALLVLLHLSGVAKHVVVDRDGTLGRMLGRTPA